MLRGFSAFSMAYLINTSTHWLLSGVGTLITLKSLGLNELPSHLHQQSNNVVVVVILIIIIIIMQLGPAVPVPRPSLDTQVLSLNEQGLDLTWVSKSRPTLSLSPTASPRKNKLLVLSCPVGQALRSPVAPVESTTQSLSHKLITTKWIGTKTINTLIQIAISSIMIY